MSIFTKVPTAKVPKSIFNLSETVKFTGDFGLIYPLYSKLMIPGDVFKVSVESFIKFMPIINPIFHEIYYKCRAFFVPLRLLDENFEETITGGEDGLSQDGIFPRWNPSKSGHGLKTSVSDVVKADSLWDFFRYPLLASDSTHHGSLVDPSSLTGSVWEDECMPLAYKLRAYNRIWNDWFRDEERQVEVTVNETESGYNSDLLRVNWKNDYFTSAALQEQRGIAPALPLSGTLPLLFSNTHNLQESLTSGFRGGTSWASQEDKNIQAYDNGESLDGTRNLVLYGQGLSSGSSAIAGYTNMTSYNNALMQKLSDGYVNMANAGTFTIPDIRFTSAVQRWMERNEECGTRYGEYLRSMYGVFPRDDRLQRPEYIGGTSTIINSSAVIQTSSSVSGSPQGNETGRLSAMNKGYIGTYKAYEFGIFMIVGYVVPKASYLTQGFPAEDLITSRYEFPNPLFAHVGNVPVKMGELFAKGYKQSGQTYGDDTAFGWQGKDDAFRVGKDAAVSEFRTDTFQSWTFDRYFSDYPSNNSSFVTCNPDTSVQFAVSSGPKFASYTGFDIKAVRPLPKYPIPMLQ